MIDRRRVQLAVKENGWNEQMYYKGLSAVVDIAMYIHIILGNLRYKCVFSI